MRMPLALLGVAAFALAAVATGGAAGKPVVIDHFQDSVPTHEILDLTAECGVTVTHFEEVKGTYIEYDDGTYRLHVNYYSVITGVPGKYLIEQEAFNIRFDGSTSTFTGLPFRLRSPDGKIVIRDVGLVSFDAVTGEVTVEHGPHPSLHEPFDICSYLT